ncbi:MULTISPECIES: M50 family metallopeptidase [Bacillaceae]|uniref:M50 family metallopeptidase n=1 Tax=Bacillales TaxID=1385 RepID=UPI0024B3ACAB|nr:MULTISPECIES: M50 family metallopeptidase [Bacillaceae]MDO6656011.1 M50 family metallopeptidase [Anaerobacillus sp. 1_MG-2023]
MVKMITIHPLFWMTIGLSILTGRFREMLLLFLVVLIHELGHAGAARFLGWRINEIVLLPFGGVAVVDEHGNRPLKEELIVILAGPLQHVWMMGVGATLHYMGIWNDMFDLFMLHNIMILLFNLLPIWPLDGGKLLFLLYSLRLPFKSAHKMMLYSSLFCFSLLIILTAILFPFHLNLWMVIVFLSVSQFKEWKHHPYIYFRFLLERYSKSFNGKKQVVTIAPDMRLNDLLATFSRGKHYHILIQDLNIETDEHFLLEAYFKKNQIACAVGTLFR